MQNPFILTTAVLFGNEFKNYEKCKFLQFIGHSHGYICICYRVHTSKEGSKTSLGQNGIEFHEISLKTSLMNLKNAV